MSPGLIQPPTGVTVRAVDGSDFVIISWNYQPDAKYYRIFFRSLKSMQGNSSSPPDEVGPMSVYCLPDNTTCSYCVSNINRTVSCNTLDSKYQAPLLRSELDFEELVSVTVEACSDIFPDACEHQSEWKNYTIPPGGRWNFTYNISNTGDCVSSDFQTPRRESKIRRVVFFYQVLGNRMKHCLEYLIYLFNQN